MPTPTIGSLLTNLTREPGRPRITWYGPDGERIELSGAVLENWVTKTANLLVEEFDAGPGTRVLLDLPGHWRTVVWAFAVWRVGACVVLDRSATTHQDVVVTDSPQAHPDADELVVVSLPALARRYDGTLPPGAVDAASAVMTYGDRIGWAPPVDQDAWALERGEGQVWRHRELAPAALTAHPWSTGSRELVAATTAEDCSLAALSAFSSDGSIVLAHPATLAAWRAQDRLDTVLASEGARPLPR